MICQECNERPATFHFTKVVNGEKTEIHICEHCAHENSSMFIDNSTGFSINNLLAGLLNLEPSINKTQQDIFKKNEVLQCSRCQMTFQQFTKVGRFGCSECYKTFNKQINPILRRVHSGNTVHSGKIPERIGGSIHVRKRIELLKQNIKELIQEEEFEKAAEIRDEIRSLELKLNSSRGGES
ncbi:UvrB/UvrC motif-containing protein [Metabacillus idriensis]|uniref:UvrB/UvrC motif-containing protein n=1 Tax=Metabacillus idriensis TaxID=324768 RepID=UPI00174CEF49|nr:UvrB/UvrC motif-containing protein [Metabacillus idriensis]